jgi:uncharacterized protein YihD (DUF1040 family)
MAEPHDEKLERVLGELRDVWKRNPTKSLMDIVMHAASFTPAFTPLDIDDDMLVTGLRLVGTNRMAKKPDARRSQATESR